MARGWSPVLVSAALVLTAGCAAAQQQQQQQQQQAAPLTADEVFSIVTRALQQELLPAVRELASLVESLDNRLTLLDSRVTELTDHIVRGGQSQREDVRGSQPAGPGAGGTPGPARSAGGPFTVSRRPDTEQQSPAEQLSPSERRQFRDCSDLPASSKSGRYLLLQGGGGQQPAAVGFCDMDTAGGNWTVIQRRDATQRGQHFNLGWNDYREGFGHLLAEFWWGLDNVWRLTSSRDRQYELRVELEDFNGTQAYAQYQNFRISSEQDGFRLALTNYTGNAGDGLSDNAGRMFSTVGRDRDAWSSGSCAEEHQGGWWYASCGLSSLNGRHDERGAAGPTGIWWFTFSRWSSLRSTEMKIRPS